MPLLCISCEFRVGLCLLFHFKSICSRKRHSSIIWVIPAAVPSHPPRQPVPTCLFVVGNVVLADVDGRGAGALAELAVVSEDGLLSIISITGMAVAGHAIVVPGDRVGSPATGNMSGRQLRLLSGGMERGAGGIIGNVYVDLLHWLHLGCIRTGMYVSFAIVCIKFH